MRSRDLRRTLRGRTVVAGDIVVEGAESGDEAGNTLCRYAYTSRASVAAASARDEQRTGVAEAPPGAVCSWRRFS